MKLELFEKLLIALAGLLSLTGVFYSATGGEQIGVILLGIVLSGFAFAGGCLLVAQRLYMERPVLPVVISSVVLLAMNASIPFTDWPLRLNYVMTRDSFDSIASRVRAGERINTPVRVGVFTVWRAEIVNQRFVCLWTNQDRYDRVGFVQCRRDEVPLSPWSQVSLDDTWQYVHED